MGESAGAGSPLSFRCPECRDRRRTWRSVQLTGKTRAYSPGAALGQRSTLVSRQYECACGHTGWSNHEDLKRKARADGVFRT